MTPSTVKPDGGGLRYDAGKPRTDLLPPDGLLELAQLYTIGAVKYGDRNWERGMPWSKVLGPLLRHLLRWMVGQARDPETGLSHMTHVAWNALALVVYELRGIGTDDIHPNPHRPYIIDADRLNLGRAVLLLVGLLLGFVLGAILTIYTLGGS